MSLNITTNDKKEVESIFENFYNLYKEAYNMGIEYEPLNLKNKSKLDIAQANFNNAVIKIYVKSKLTYTFFKLSSINSLECRKICTELKQDFQDLLLLIGDKTDIEKYRKEFINEINEFYERNSV